MKRYLLLGSIFIISTLHANNISVTNVTLAGQNVSAGPNNAANFTYIEFDLSWENSWRTSASPNNWDAAWIFIKYRTVGGSTWNHVYLAPNGHASSGTGTGYSVQVGLVNEGLGHNASSNPAVGAFIYRKTDGTGTFTAQDIRLKWFYRDNGVGDNDIIDVDVYAIEMVYVPDGTFSIGNNGSAGATINRPFYKMGSPNTSYEITSEALINSSGTGGSSGQLIHPEWGTNNLIPIPAAFPKGYAGFYCMKYEASQQNWVDYLNSLTSAQQANMPTTTMSRNGISSSAGVYSTTLPFVPMSGVYWPDVAAYLDWSGLRVMTEFEFEKACRGTATVVTDEFAWGNSTYTTHTNTPPTNAGLTNEVSPVSGANTALSITTNPGTSPLRAGSFATSSTTRAQAGASFYGIMDMTGNVSEQVATTVNYQGTVTTYTGLHGNGSLTSAGYANVTDWPGSSSGFISTSGLAASTTACRGGSWFLGSANYGRVADRFWNTIDRGGSGLSINRTDPQNYEKGVRGVHTKPITASETK